MVLLDELTQFLNEYLEIKNIKEAAFNGLQFEGKQEIEKIAVAVDSGEEIFKKAADLDADFIIVHHGIFLEGLDPSLVGWKKRRINILYQNNISLYGAHLPLDMHKEVGNNAQLLKLLGAEIKRPFATIRGTKIGWIGQFSEPVSVEKISQILENSLNIRCFLLPFGPIVKTIAVCSGGGGYGRFFEAVDEQVDLYISGDTVDIYQMAKDVSINVIFAGHNATETLGVKALAKVLSAKFDVETEFIDAPTGL